MVQLEQMGWRSLVIWECQTKNQETLEQLASAIATPPVNSSASD